MTQSEKSRKDAKRQRRLAAIAARREAQRRREAERRRRLWIMYGGLAAAVIVVAGLVAGAGLRGRAGIVEVPGSPAARAGLATPSGPPARPSGAGTAGQAATPGGDHATAGPALSGSARLVVETYPDQGRAHIALGDAHPAYNSNPPTSGWHTPQAAPWGAFRTVMADEILVHNLEHGGIWISYRDPTDTALVGKLEALASRYRSKVIVTPRPRNDAPIAVAAWTKLLKLQAFDEAAIVKFIETYKNRGPEKVPD